MRLTLVSASPRRAALLRQLNIPFDVEPTTASEDWLADTDKALAMCNARKKVERSPHVGDRSRLLLGADTLICFDGIVLGKPVGPESAARMLRLLSGRRHRVVTGICVAGPAANRESTTHWAVAYAVSAVTFRPLSDRDIRNYIRSREWEGKAGGYAIQERASAFIAELDGDFDNVVGLPLGLVRDLLGKEFVHCRLR